MYRLWFLFLLSLGGCGSGRECTLMYVPDSVRVSFVRSSRWEPGRYRVEAADAVCEATFPAAPESSGIVPCQTPTNAPMQSFLEVDAARSGLEALVYESGAPQTLVVRVLWNDTELAREMLTPTYSQSEPNGRGCGVTRSGSAQMSF